MVKKTNLIGLILVIITLWMILIPIETQTFIDQDTMELCEEKRDNYIGYGHTCVGDCVLQTQAMRDCWHDAGIDNAPTLGEYGFVSDNTAACSDLWKYDEGGNDLYYAVIWHCTYGNNDPRDHLNLGLPCVNAPESCNENYVCSGNFCAQYFCTSDTDCPPSQTCNTGVGLCEDQINLWEVADTSGNNAIEWDEVNPAIANWISGTYNWDIINSVVNKWLE